MIEQYIIKVICLALVFFIPFSIIYATRVYNLFDNLFRKKYGL